MTWTKWKKGNPPAAGWFNASRERTANLLRQWDGRAWSLPFPEDGLLLDKPRRDTRYTEGIEWRDYSRAFRRVLQEANGTPQGHGVR